MKLFDRLKITSERTYTDEGFMRVPATISRVGIQEYLAFEMGLTDGDMNRVIKVYRPEGEVFDETSLSSFTNKPVTNNHPPELVDATNAKDYTVGMSIAEAVRDGDLVSTELIITDADAISEIEGGKVELSNGYTADIDWTPGIAPGGIQFDAIQRNIRGNHIAIVERGRAGSACKVADNNPQTNGTGAYMAKITIDGVDFEVSEQAAQAVGKLQTENSGIKNSLQDANSKLEAKDSEIADAKAEVKSVTDSMQAKIDDAETKIPNAETMDKLVSARQKLVSQAKAICPDIKWQGKDNETIVKEVVSAKCSNVQMDSVSIDYINARFDMLVENLDSNSQHSLDSAFSDAVSSEDEDEEMKDEDEDNMKESEKARQKMADSARNAWKNGGDK